MSRVYFIKPVGMDGPIKIGCSVAPERRRRALSTWSPFRLEIVAEIEGSFNLERRFHALFAETHQRREWFGWSKRIAAVIAAINDGTFDVATLPAPICIVANPRRGKGTRAGEWSPARRFGTAVQMRRLALKRRGAPWGELIEGCNFSTYALQNAEYARQYDYPAPEVMIRRAEAHLDVMTAKYGHDGMKPVRWSGPLPAPADQPVAA